MLVSGPTLGDTTLPTVILGTADLAADRRMDLGIGQVDLCDAQLRLRTRKLCRLRPLRGNRIVHRRALTGGRVQQRLRAGELDIGVGEPGAGIRDGRLLLRHRGHERRLFQAIEQIALLHLGAFDEQALIEECGHPRGERHAVHSLDAADEFGRLGDGLTRRADHADRRRPTRHLGLRGAEPRKRRKQRGQAAQSHRPSFSGLLHRGMRGRFNREGDACRSTGLSKRVKYCHLLSFPRKREPRGTSTGSTPGSPRSRG